MSLGATISGNIEIKALEFLDDVADQNMGVKDAVKSNKIITDVINYKKLNFSSDKCKDLKVNSKSTKCQSASIDIVNLEVKPNFKYLEIYSIAKEIILI